MDVVLAERVDDLVAAEHVEDRRLDPCEADLGTVGLGELDDLADGARPLGIDEVDPLEGDHDRVVRRIGVLGELAQPVGERVGAGEEQPGVEAQDEQARVRHRVGVLLDGMEGLCPWLATEDRCLRGGADVHQPPEREHDTDDHAGENPGGQHGDDGGDRDPEIDARHPVEPPHLCHVHHPENDRVDDQRGQHLGTVVQGQLLALDGLSEGGLIHDGVDGRLDGLRNRLDDQDQWLAAQEQEERRRSGIPTLRLQFHRSFGYFLSVSRARAERVPEHWIRRQTLANEERFVTPELKAREGRILQLRARAAQREYELFSQLRQQVGELAGPIRQAARRVAGLDALASLAEVAACHGYCRPQLDHSRCLQVEAGRHPVVEQLLVEESFSANDLHLGEQGRPDLVVLTGPNASGKSCYLRQNGLLQLMAQIGSWIPARSARLGLADRIFTRVGAVDDLASGQSTFMVEMAETANILHHASPRSLVLLDEIGRGTATFDGLSIAWAVAEHLATPAERGGIGARSIFATHYHELNALAEQLPNVANAQVLVQETGDALVFLHRVAPGGASRSYGIEAARLAGVPAAVVLRARQVLGRIEANSVVRVDQGDGVGADGALAA